MIMKSKNLTGMEQSILKDKFDIKWIEKLKVWDQ